MSAFVPNDWNKMGGDIYGENTLDGRGSTVELSEDGKILATLSGPGAGRDISEHHGLVKVYQWTGLEWTRKGLDIQNSMPQGSSTIGHMCMSRDGNRLAVSEYYVNPPQEAGLGWGRVKVYGWNGSSWVAVGQPIVYENEMNLFNSSLSLNLQGNVLAIGSPSMDLPNPAGGYYIMAGMVRVYSLTGSSWSQRGEQMSDLARSGLGVSLSDDGNSLASGSSAGVKVHLWNGSSWNRKGGDIQGKEAGDGFGSTVRISGDGSTLVSGASMLPGAEDTSYVRAFSWNGSSWIQKGAEITEFYDNSLSVSKRGNVIATGAMNGWVMGNGIARVHEWTGSSWRRMGKNFRGVAIPGEGFGSRAGQSVAVSGDGKVLAVGEPGLSTLYDYTGGRVYIYEWSREKPSVLFVRW